jgi:hypothetical protein
MTSTLVLALAVAAPLSQSRLGVVASGNDPATDAVIASSPCARILVLPIPGDGAASAQLAAYRANCPGGTAIARVGNPGQPVTPGVGGTIDLLGATWRSQVAALGGPVDAVEGPSEPTAVSSDALAQFWSEFADVFGLSGVMPVVGAITASAAFASSASDAFCATATAMQGKGYDWRWSFHARSPMTQDLATEADATFGYRRIRTDCALAKPVIVSEAGPAGRPWSASDGSWLAFFDRQLALDTDVVGAALAPGFAPVLPDLLARLGAAPADGGAPDAGAPDGGGQGGVVPPPTTAPGGPLVPVSTKGGCSTGAAAALLACLAPLAARLRRRQGPGVKR